jgi:hypothetical protein
MTWRRSTILSLCTGAALVLACGQGNVILDVDLLSFQPSLADTSPAFPVPGGFTISDSIPVFGAHLLKGLQSKTTVDTVTLSLGASVLNTSGSGTVKIKIFFGQDSLTTYSAPIDTASASVTFTQPDTLPLGPLDIPLTASNIFSGDQVWIGVKASVAATTAMNARYALNRVRLRVVLSDKIF